MLNIITSKICAGRRMAVEWMDVADNAVKIGLGSLLTILGGWMTLKLTHQNEIRKEAAVQQVRNTNKKIERYIQFLSMSQSLMQTYLFKECEGSSDLKLQPGAGEAGGEDGGLTGAASAQTRRTITKSANKTLKFNKKGVEKH